MSRVAIYARVSTDDRGQSPENQLAQLRTWSAAAGHTIAGEYIDHVSGVKGADERPELARMLDDAHRRKFDLLLCWSLDRLSREGLEPTIGYLRRLGNAGVAFHSYSEPMLSTDNPIVRDVLLAVMASMASMERARISERTKAGLQRVRESGVKLGRRPIEDSRQAEIAALAGEGLTAYAIGSALASISKPRSDIWPYSSATLGYGVPAWCTTLNGSHRKRPSPICCIFRRSSWGRFS